VPCIRLTLEYDGRAFAGWQVQPGAVRSVQGALEDALAAITGERVRVIGAGRTDAGVHAEGQVASAPIETELSPQVLRRALNAHLGPDLVVLRADTAPEGFHALRDARAKLYRYAVWNGEDRSPLRGARFWHVPVPLDLGAMQQAATAFVGTHDFASLQATGSSVTTTVRTISRLDLEGDTRGEIRIWVEGDGFLRRMVRSLAGTLVEVGLGRRSEDGMAALLAARDRSRAGLSAPAHGLTLVRVGY
jgi:tRNA pseudouridine38-40 synthase